MRYSLLDMVQTILSSMDSDEVNSINDTTESQQVVKIIRTCYFDIVLRKNLPEHYELFKLDAIGDATKPVWMKKPTDIDKVLWIKYDKRLAGESDPLMAPVRWQEPNQFIQESTQLRATASNVEAMNYKGNTLYFLNDRAPLYYTSFNDNDIIFDSYDSTVEATLQQSKTLCYGTREVAWTEDDDFIFDLDLREHSLLLQEAKALAFAELKQTEHASAERAARRHQVRLQREKFDVKKGPYQDWPHYGRK
jgi:hypothetical protein